MKLSMFNEFQLGVVKENRIVSVGEAVKDMDYHTPQELMEKVIINFTQLAPRFQEIVNKNEGVPIASVRIRPPLPKPTNIDCMAVNYLEDASSVSAPINAFHKSPSAIIGDGDTMVLPDVPATIFEGEAELAVVIGKRATRVNQAEAMNYAFGYLNFIDGSARGLPPAGNSFYQMKSRDTFAPIGPYLVTADEVPDPHNLKVQLWNNGILMQDYTTSRMDNKIPRCIEWITSIHTLEPGDIVATGTNHHGLNPFLGGDLIEIEIEGLGRLHFQVRDDLKRTWARETRLDRQQKQLEGATPQLTGKYATKPS